MTTNHWVTLEDCVGIRWSRSKEALQVEYEDKAYWIPNSCIHDDSECHAPDTEGTLKIPESLAIDKEMV
jgi:hypothetical protein